MAKLVPKVQGSGRNEQALLIRAVERRFGLSLQPALHSLITKAARELVSQKHARSIVQIVAKLTAAGESDPIIHRMRETVSVLETHFFRGREQLQSVITEMKRLLADRPRGTVRVWSAACATGEEPYSLAILLRTHLPDVKVEVVGTDMNPAALKVAETGVYGPSSFREVTPESLGGWLTPTGPKSWAVTPALRQLVKFQRLNLVKDTFPVQARGLAAFQLVVCRNVLIYLEPRAVQGVMEKLEASCITDGLLVLTPPEFSAARYLPNFRPLPQAIYVRGPGLRRVDLSPAPPPPVVVLPDTRPRSSPERFRPLAPTPAPVANKPAARSVAAPLPRLDEAQQLADAGQLAGALSVLQAVLAAQPDCAPAYCLRGIFIASNGQLEEAVTAFQRALYLDRELIAAELGLGEVLARMRQGAASASRYERALRLLSPMKDDDAVPWLGTSAAVARRLAKAGRGLG